MTLHIYAPPGEPGGSAEAPRMGTAMHREDIQRAIARHKRCPHAYTAYAVACNVLWYRRQVGLDLRPKELAEMLGIHYDHARSVLKRVKADDECSTKPEDSAPEHNAPEDSAPEDSAPVDRRIVLRSASPPHPLIEREDKALSLPHAPACEEPNPASPEPERDAVVEWAARVAPNLDYWTRNAVETWPAAWVRAVLERKAIGQKHTPSPALLTKILQDWTRAGECEYLAGPPPLRPTGTAGQQAPRNSRVHRDVLGALEGT